MLAQVSTWWTILRISVEERLVYRADFALGTLMRFLPIVTQIFLWGAVFQAANPSGPGEKTVAGYSYPEVIAYYMLTMISRAFSSMPGLASGIARDIRMGTVKKYLIQPIDMLGFLLLYRAAHKAVYYLVAAVPFAIVFYLLRDYFPRLFRWLRFENRARRHLLPPGDEDLSLGIPKGNATWYPGFCKEQESKPLYC